RITYMISNTRAFANSLPPDLKWFVFFHTQNVFAQLITLKFHEVPVTHMLLQTAVPDRLGQTFLPCLYKRLFTRLFQYTSIQFQHEIRLPDFLLIQYAKYGTVHKNRFENFGHIK